MFENQSRLTSTANYKCDSLSLEICVIYLLQEFTSCKAILCEYSKLRIPQNTAEFHYTHDIKTQHKISDKTLMYITDNVVISMKTKSTLEMSINAFLCNL